MAAREDFKVLGFAISNELKDAYVETYPLRDLLNDQRDVYQQIVTDNLAELKGFLGIDAENLLSEEDKIQAVSQALVSFSEEKAPIVSEDNVDEAKDLDEAELLNVIKYLKIKKSDEPDVEKATEENFAAINEYLGIKPSADMTESISKLNEALEKHNDEAQRKLYEIKPIQDFMFLRAFEKETLASESYPHDGVKNRSELKKGPDDKLRLIMQNLGGAGLNFTIEDDKSIVLAPDSKLTTEQVKELSRFFYIHGIGHTGVEEFKFPNDVKIEPDAKNPQPASLQETFAQGLQEAAAEDEKIHHQELANDPAYAKWFNGESNDCESTGDSSKPMKPSLSSMADSCKARIAIGLNVRGKLLKSRRALDGSIVFSCYLDEPSMRHDGENNKGDIKRSKLCAFKIDIIKGRPTVSCYIPDGKVIEASHTKVMLEILKKEGAEYFTMPNAVMTSGKGQGAFWTSAGKTLMVPLCHTEDYPEGALIAGDHVADMLDAIKKETKLDRNAILEWKRKMFDELEAQEAFQRKKFNDPIRKEFDAKLAANPEFINIYKQRYDLLCRENLNRHSSFVEYARQAYINDHPKAYTTNSALQDRMNDLDGAIQYDTFKKKYMGPLNKVVTDGLQGTNGKEPWDIIEAAAAYRALAEITKRFGTDKELRKYMGKDNEETAHLIVAMQEEMVIQKAKIAEEVKIIGYSQANRSLGQGTHAILEGIAADIQEDSGADIKFPGGYGGRTLTSEWTKKYFNDSGQYIGNVKPRNSTASPAAQKAIAAKVKVM